MLNAKINIKIIISITIVILFVALIITWSARRPESLDSHTWVNTTGVLEKICFRIAVTGVISEPIPTKLPEFVRWLDHYSPFPLEEKDPKIWKKDSIKDGWGNDIVIISNNGKFLGVGSCGSNGKWEGGKGDDLVLTLEDYNNGIKP